MIDTKLTIQQVSEHTGLTSHTLRYYEKIGLIDGVDRDVNGYRRYDRHVVEWIDWLICLRATGMSMRQLQKYAELCKFGEASVLERMELLENHRQKLHGKIALLNRYLNRLEVKLELYQRGSVPASQPQIESEVVN
jgi:DNA-binding transcriptional MerR regulator